MLSSKVRDYLEDHHIHYSTIRHPAAYTGPQTAQAAHVPGGKFAKVVMIKVKGKLVMIALAANTHLDLKSLQKFWHTDKLELAREYEFNDAFPDCDVGAMPPLGDLYGLDTYMAESLTKEHWIAFNAGDHSELVKIPMNEFLQLVHPTLIPNC